MPILRIEAANTETTAAYKKAGSPRFVKTNIPILVGEIPVDPSPFIGSVLKECSPKTRLITNACSSLQSGSVLNGRQRPGNKIGFEFGRSGAKILSEQSRS